MPNEEIVEIKKKLEEHEKRISKLESSFQSEPEAVKKEVSIKEFMISKKPNNDVQKTLTIAFHLEKYKNFSSFNVKDLERNFRAAKEKVPKNVGDKVQKNIKKDYMMDAEEKKDNIKAWVLTNSGEEHVENGFKKEK